MTNKKKKIKITTINYYVYYNDLYRLLLKTIKTFLDNLVGRMLGYIIIMIITISVCNINHLSGTLRQECIQCDQGLLSS